MMRVRDLGPDMVEYVVPDMLRVVVERFTSNGSGEVRWCDRNWSTGARWFDRWQDARTFAFALANAGDVRYVDNHAPSTLCEQDPQGSATWRRFVGDVTLVRGITTCEGVDY